MKKGLCIFLCLIAGLALSQSSSYFYTRFGGEQDDIGNSVTQLLNGNYAVVGQTNGFSSLQTDVYLAITSQYGFPILQKNIGGFLMEGASGVACLNDSSILLVGYTNSFGNGGYDAYIVKVSQQGNVLWQKTVGGTDWDFANSVYKTNDGNVIISGSTYSYSRGRKDAFILKMDYSGNVVWFKNYGGKQDDELNEVIATSDGGYIGCGTTKSYGDSLGDIWITKFDAGGDSLWFITKGGNKKENGRAISQNLQGDYFVAGGTESYGAGKEDAYIFKLLKNKSVLWDTTYGLANQDERIHTAKSCSGGKGAVVFSYTTKEKPGFGKDSKILWLDSMGNYAGGGILGSDRDEEIYSISNAADKGHIMVGYTDGFTAAHHDIYMIKFDTLMNPGTFTVGLNSYHPKQQPFIYPNPFKNQLTISNPPGQKINGVDIIDVSGSAILSTENKSGETVKLYNLNLVKGVYIIRIHTDNVIYYRKLICEGEY